MCAAVATATKQAALSLLNRASASHKSERRLRPLPIASKYAMPKVSIQRSWAPAIHTSGPPHTDKHAAPAVAIAAARAPARRWL
jgi:hypothetical protein